MMPSMNNMLPVLVLLVSTMARPLISDHAAGGLAANGKPTGFVAVSGEAIQTIGTKGYITSTGNLGTNAAVSAGSNVVGPPTNGISNAGAILSLHGSADSRMSGSTTPVNENAQINTGANGAPGTGTRPPADSGRVSTSDNTSIIDNQNPPSVQAGGSARTGATRPKTLDTPNNSAGTSANGALDTSGSGTRTRLPADSGRVSLSDNVSVIGSQNSPSAQADGSTRVSGATGQSKTFGTSNEGAGASGDSNAAVSLGAVDKKGKLSNTNEQAGNTAAVAGKPAEAKGRVAPSTDTVSGQTDQSSDQANILLSVGRTAGPANQFGDKGADHLTEFNDILKVDGDLSGVERIVSQDKSDAKLNVGCSCKQDN